MEAAGHAVHLSFELPAAMHPRQDELDARYPILRMDVHRDAAPVVGDRDGTIGVQRDLDFLAEPRHRLIDRVVDDFVDEVVEPAAIDRTDVHGGPLSDRLEPFQDLDLLSVVGGFFYHLFRNLPERLRSRLAAHPVGYLEYTKGLYKR